MIWFWVTTSILIILFLIILRDDRWMSYVWRNRFHPGDKITVYHRNRYGVMENEMSFGVFKVYPKARTILLDDNVATKISMRWLFSQVYNENKRIIIEHTDAYGCICQNTFERWHPFIS